MHFRARTTASGAQATRMPGARIRKKGGTRRKARERGAAAIELAMMAPMVILLASFMFDATTYLLAIMNVDSISTAAASYVTSRNASEVSEDDVLAAMEKSFPNMNASGASVRISLVDGPVVREPLAYPIYLEESLNELDTEMNVNTYTVTVTASQAWPFLGTVLGDASGRFQVTATKYCEADNMQESTWRLQG